MVEVNTGPITADLSPSDVPQDKWRILANEWRSFVAVKFPYDCRELSRFINEANDAGMWQALGYESLEAFIYQRLELDPEQVNWALEGLEIYGVDKPIGLNEAAEKAKQMIADGSSYRKAAEETGIPKSTLHRKLSQVGPKRDKRNQAGFVQVYPNTDPTAAAQRIRERLGDTFADALKEAL